MPPFRKKYPVKQTRLFIHTFIDYKTKEEEEEKKRRQRQERVRWVGPAHLLSLEDKERK
jgi:hypothetical protein